MHTFYHINCVLRRPVFTNKQLAHNKLNSFSNYWKIIQQLQYNQSNVRLNIN